MGKTIIGTRIYSDPTGTYPSFSKLERWVGQGLLHSDLLVIATDSANYEKISNLETVRSAVTKIIVTISDISQNFVRPLNHILEIALHQRADALIYQSIEIDAQPHQIQSLRHHLDEQTLVVGAKIVEEHGSSRGRVPLTGWDSPWNTLAIWNPKKLGMIGFLPISGSLHTDVPGGAEEVAVISLLQKISSKSHLAKLVDVGPINWDVNFDSEWRLKYHQQKLRSKSQRAAAQLEALGISPGFLSIL